MNCRSIVDYRNPPPAVQSREESRRHASGMNDYFLRIASQSGRFGYCTTTLLRGVVRNYLPGTGGTAAGRGATAVVSVGVTLSVALAAIRSASARLATRTAAAKPGCSGVMFYDSHVGLLGRHPTPIWHRSMLATTPSTHSSRCCVAAIPTPPSFVPGFLPRLRFIRGPLVSVLAYKSQQPFDL
jgi:hypothetical protein